MSTREEQDSGGDLPEECHEAFWTKLRGNAFAINKDDITAFVGVQEVAAVWTDSMHEVSALFGNECCISSLGFSSFLST